MAWIPSAVRAIQSDGGSESLEDFQTAVADLRLTHSFNPSRYLQGNGRIDRSFRIDDEEFCQVADFPADVGGLDQALLAYNRASETVRPHYALGYQTPGQCYRRRLAAHQTGEEVLSEMS